MSEILFYFLLGGLIFIIFFIILLYLARKFKRFLKKKYIPETATSFKCIDGHIVKSKGELIIDNFLYNHRIEHEYENKIKINGKEVKYDWFLPEYKIYIEYWGYYGKDYMKRKEEKVSLYRKGKLKLISIEDIMFKDIYQNLTELLKQYIDVKIMEKHCPNCGKLLDERF